MVEDKEIEIDDLNREILLFMLDRGCVSEEEIINHVLSLISEEGLWECDTCFAIYKTGTINECGDLCPSCGGDLFTEVTESEVRGQFNQT